MDLFSSLLRGPGFAPSSRAGAPAPTPFVIDDDELLGHMGYFSQAFCGEPWEPGLSFALKIEEMGDYIVAHAEGSIYVCKRAEGVRGHPRTTREDRRPLLNRRSRASIAETASSPITATAVSRDGFSLRTASS